MELSQKFLKKFQKNPKNFEKNLKKISKNSPKISGLRGSRFEVRGQRLEAARRAQGVRISTAGFVSLAQLRVFAGFGIRL